MGWIPPAVPVDPKDAEIARLKTELERFKQENAKLVRQLNAERKHVAEVENENKRLDRENIQLRAPDARANLASMLDDIRGE